MEEYQIDYNENKLFELFTMLNDYRDFGIKPWDIKGKFLVEDITALRMMMIIQNDVDKMKERAEQAKEKTRKDLMK